MRALRNFVREQRLRAGLQQRDLAATIGVSRQSLSAIESGATVPSTALALELARALGCRVEDLFGLAAQDAEPLRASFVPAGAKPSAGSRVRLGLVRGGWQAHSLDGASGESTPADALVARGGKLYPLRDGDALRANLLVAGCDPALGLLGGHLLDGAARLRLHWIEASSAAALDALERGQVHLAGLHLVDDATGEHNVPAVRARFGGRPMILVNLATWEQGFVTRKGRKVRRVADLADRGVRVVLREPGSGARALLDRLLAAERLPLKTLHTTGAAGGHHAVARAVAASEADVGIATAAAAAAFGLEFTPLAADVFDLVMFAETLQTPSVQRLLDTMTSRRFQRDAGALPGYGLARAGKIVAQVAA